KAAAGVRKIFIFSPSFVADCMETIVEIGHEYRKLFASHGGEQIQLAPALNDSQEWVDFLADLVKTSGV
ncbi:MAG: ferrochelatase, partial [Prolixibacteraceae bacterium]|nr:ferrochelatase [Prolixibacteraceae bacterium]